MLMLLTKSKRILAVTAFSLAFLMTRIPFLGYDEINPDAVNWHFRSEQFVVGLKSGDFLKTYQHYHPGVTLMWLMGAPIEIYRQINPHDRVYTEDNFLVQHQTAKYSIIAAQLVLSIVLILALKNILGLKKSLLAVSIFSFEPFFLGNSRLLHMDVLLSLFIILSLTYAYKYYMQRSVTYAFVSGVFAGLAFLTKSVGLLIVGVTAITELAILLKEKRSTTHLWVFLLSSFVTIFIFFPALWARPQFVLSDIYNEGLRIGTRRGHEQVILGDQTDAAGPIFYPLVMALKTSPLIWLGIGMFLWQVTRNHRRYQKVEKMLLLYLAVFYLIYFLGMSVASKKIDRYMLPLYPLLGLISSISILEAVRGVRGQYNKVSLYIMLTLATGLGVVYPLIKLYPYYFTYTNPFFGSVESANKIVGQKPFGIGIPELKSRIEIKYGQNVSLGFIDKKPMSMIYKNSKLYDIRETGTKKYDLIILGPNEEMPENVTEGQFKFVKDNSIYINGLEFWRIYKKV